MYVLLSYVDGEFLEIPVQTALRESFYVPCFVC